jgi:hypothetical protein
MHLRSAPTSTLPGEALARQAATHQPAHIGTYALPGWPRRTAHIAGYALPVSGLCLGLWLVDAFDRW